MRALLEVVVCLKLSNSFAAIDCLLMTCRYLPRVDTYNRFMYVLQVFISQGMYVILDYQVWLVAYHRCFPDASSKRN